MLKSENCISIPSQAVASPCQIFQLSTKNLPTRRFDNNREHLAPLQMANPASGNIPIPSFGRCEKPPRRQIRSSEMDSHKGPLLAAIHRISAQCSNDGDHDETPGTTSAFSPPHSECRSSRAFLEIHNVLLDYQE